jgi:hypothetical protein
MSHSLESTDRVAHPWVANDWWAGRFGQAVTFAVHWAKLACGFAAVNPPLRVSQAWLDEHERHSQKRPDHV